MSIIDARAWHLTDLDDGGSAAAAPTHDGIGEDGGTLARLPAALPPLWVRVLIGASFAWRARALLRAVTRERRRVARGALRWLQLHVVVRTQLEQGRPLAAARAAREDVAAPATVHWPVRSLPVHVCGVDAVHPLLRHAVPLADDALRAAGAAVRAGSGAAAAADGSDGSGGSDGVPPTLVGPGCTHPPGAHAGALVAVGIALPGARVCIGGPGPPDTPGWLPTRSTPPRTTPSGSASTTWPDTSPWRAGGWARIRPGRCAC